MIDWSRITRVESDLISKIVNRGISLAKSLGGPDINKLDAVMDLKAAHLEVGLRLNKLLEADDSNFGHDFFGIRRYMNRSSGKLEACFVPRCARSDTAKDAAE